VPLESTPCIVAEALVEIRDPLETVLALGPAAPAAEVAAAIAQSLAPPMAGVAVPAWLRPDQITPFRRAVAALQRYRGALLADPVGSGKTWVGLAVAATLAPGQTIVAIVPAALGRQWSVTAARTGLPVTVVSHEAVSRGHLPASSTPVVLVDESHHFRNPATRRYPALARWLLGRQALLLSATPIVNRMADLAHQLLLAVRDDALLPRGCPSLLIALGANQPPPALGDLVLCRPDPAAKPVARLRSEGLPLSRGALDVLAEIERLTLSHDPGVATLIRMVLIRALASSPGALVGALQRYARLLAHATHAAETGRRPARSAIQAFTGPDPEQLLLWELLPAEGAAPDIALEDSAQLARLLELGSGLVAGADLKCSRLREVLLDAEPTIVFTTSRDTLAWLKQRLGDLDPAWVTGEAAGIGRTRMAREDVLAWFRAGRPAPAAAVREPWLLLATDVAAEGLDLQAAGRVVHYDLPWTSVRLDQRNGRALRLGSTRSRVEVVVFRPAPELERRLGQLFRLRDKRRLARRAGLDPGDPWLFRWRADLVDSESPVLATPCISVMEGKTGGWLIGLALDAAVDPDRLDSLPARLLWIGDDGSMSEDPRVLVPFLVEADTAQWRAPTLEERGEAVAALAPLVRACLRRAGGEAWLGGALAGEQRALLARLRRLASAAARRRDGTRLALLDRALDWLSGGLSAGEALLVRDCRGLGIRRLLPALDRLQAVPRQRAAPVPRLTGVVRVASFPACPPSAPCSSISTAR